VLSDDVATGRHARLAPGEHGWTVEDLGSTNGTQLDGAPLGGPRPAQAGSLLTIGRTVIELRR
jgi:pSer/pThr/pTyr-binding forkhead associated (FHA) protein